MKIFNDDCFNIIKNIQEDVKLVCVDLPYGVLECKWDVKIDLEEMWKQLKKVCNKKCNYLFFADMRLAVELIQSNPRQFKYEIIWDKERSSNPFNANKMPLRKHEFILVFGSGGVYNPQKTYGHSNYSSVYKNIASLDGSCFSRVKRTDCVNTDGSRFPTSILSFKKEIGKKVKHPTQKPAALLENLIKQYSNEEDWVLDFTMGSGSCGVVCKNTNRNFIGVEKDEKYFKIAEENLRDDTTLMG